MENKPGAGGGKGEGKSRVVGAMELWNYGTMEKERWLGRGSGMRLSSGQRRVEEEGDEKGVAGGRAVRLLHLYKSSLDAQHHSPRRLPIPYPNVPIPRESKRGQVSRRGEGEDLERIDPRQGK